MAMQCRKNERGFTLIELLIVIAIIATIAGIGIIQYRTVQAERQLDRVALDLAEDIRWLQQMSINDAGYRQADPPVYRYHLKLWANGYSPTKPVEKANQYVVFDNDKELKRYDFTDSGVTATVLSNTKLNVDITYFAYDLDLKISNQYVNSTYRIQLMIAGLTAVRFVNVDSVSGRVWINSDPNEKPY